MLRASGDRRRRSRISMRRFALSFAVLLAVLLGVASVLAKPRADEAEVAASNKLAGGRHWRLELAGGPVHVWQPAKYDAKHAGLVLYVHGYGPGVDDVFVDHKLAEQFRDSRQNALFIVPEAARGNADAVRFANLDALLRDVRAALRIRWPEGPLVTMGHSGAFRTLLAWLDAPRLRDVILLDALYAGQERFAGWLVKEPRHPAHRLIAIAEDTLPQANQLAVAVEPARRQSMPAIATAFTHAQRRARFLLIESQYRHLEMVTNQRVIPQLLRLTSLKKL